MTKRQIKISKNILWYLLDIVLLIVIFAPTKVGAIEAVYEVLKQDSGTGATIKEIWRTLMDTVNSIAIVILIVVAFVEILHINVSTYGIKKILPTLIFAILAANFSFIFCRLLIDISNIAITLFVPDSKTIAAPVPEWPYGLPPKIPWKGFIDGLSTTFLVNLVVFAESILFFILAFLMVIRNWMVYFLVSVSSVAMITMAFPQTKSLFNQWWQQLIRWVFMPVVSMMFVWLAMKFSLLIEGSSTGVNLGANLGGAKVMGAVFTAACLYGAIMMPFKLGGSIMTGWGNLIKKPAQAGSKWALNKAKTKWVDPLVDDYKQRIGNWYASKASSTPGVRAKWGKKIDAARKAGKSEADIDKMKEAMEEEVKHRATFAGNPLGYMRRRSLRIAYDRDLRKKEGEGWIDQGTREALGGKEGEYLTLAQREKRGNWFEDVNTLFGEKEWAEKRMKREYMEKQKRDTSNPEELEKEKKHREELANSGNGELDKLRESKSEIERYAASSREQARSGGATEEDIERMEKEIKGQTEEIDKRIETRLKKLAEELGTSDELIASHGGYSTAALNSVQFDMRVAADDQALANMKNMAVGMAYRADNTFLANGQWEGVYDDLAKQKSISIPLEKTANKATSDFGREAMAVPIKLNEEIAGFQKAVKSFERATKVIADLERQKAGADPATIAKLDQQIVEARKQQNYSKKMSEDAERAYKAQIKGIKETPRYFDQATGKMKGIAASALHGMIDVGTNGTIVDDIRQARSMSQVNGIPESIEYLFRDRTAKTLSEIVKQELAGEKEKRTAIESARLIRDELKEDFKLLSAGRGNELGAEKFWKVSAAANNALSVGHTSAEYSEIKGILGGIHAETAREGDVHAFHDMARVDQGAIDELMNNETTMLEAKKGAIAKFLQEKHGDAYGLTGVKPEDLGKKVEELRLKQGAAIDQLLASDQESIDKYLKTTMIDQISRKTRISAEKLSKFANMSYGADGLMSMDLAGTRNVGDKLYEENIDFLQQIQRAYESASLRGIGEYLRRGSEKVSSTSILEAALNREAGKSLDMSRGMEGQRSRLLGGNLGYNEAALKGYYGEDRFNSSFAGRP